MVSPASPPVWMPADPRGPGARTATGPRTGSLAIPERPDLASIGREEPIRTVCTTGVAVTSATLPTPSPPGPVPGWRRRVARAEERTPTLLAAAIVPAVAPAVAGASHPRDLGPATAVRWTDVHLVALPLFGLPGLARWLLLRRRGRVLGLAGAVLAWVHAASCTGLDVLAGIGAGTLRERAGGAGVGEVFPRGDQLARVGTAAYCCSPSCRPRRCWRTPRCDGWDPGVPGPPSVRCWWRWRRSPTCPVTSGGRAAG